MRGHGWRFTCLKSTATAALVAGVIAFGAGPAGAQVKSTATLPNPIWAGYAVSGTAGAFNNVTASWAQPAVTCTAGETSYSSYWVGLDGLNSRTVEQIGTDSDCINGTATYYAWYEIYPKRATLISSVSVTGGTPINASVSYAPPAAHGHGTFTVTLNGFSTSAASPSAQRSSAEVIVEAPSSNHGPFGALSLSDFGTVTFSGAMANGSPLGASSYASSLTELVLQNAGTVEASPNDSLKKSRFTVTRENA